MIRVHAKGGARAEILIYDPIGQDWYGNGVTAKKFRDDLSAVGDVQDIVVRINSPGGEVFDGFAIYNALKQHPAKVVVHVDGLAASIASVIAMAGDEVVMGEGAMFMIHSPWTLAMGNADQLRDMADTLDKVEVGLVDAYVAKTGKSREDVEEWMNGETWFTRDEAIEAGLADARDAAPSSDETPEQVAAWRASARSKRRASAEFHKIAASVFLKAPVQSERESNPAADKPLTPGEKTMTEDEIRAAREAAAKQAREDALKAEKARQDGIRALFAKFPQHRDLCDQKIADQAITVEAASKALLDVLGGEASPLTPSVGRIEAGADARTKFVAGASAAILARSGHGKRDEGNEFSGFALSDFAARALELAGHSTRGLTRDGIARKVLATHTSTDFPQLLSVTAGKVLRTAYDNFPNTWNLWAAAGQVSDFKVHPRIQLGSFGNLPVIPEGAEYTYGSLSEEFENAQAQTRGRAIALTRQMIVNDDLGGFARRASLLGRSAARSVNTDAYTYLTSGASNNGPTTGDGGQYFNATAPAVGGTGHGNLAGSGTVINVTNLGTARSAMRRQRDRSLSETLNIQPRVLLVSVAREDLAREIVTSTTKDGQANPNIPNVLRNQFEVVSDPFLDGIGSGLPWYLMANPADIAAFEVVFLDGNQSPFVDEMIDFESDAMKFKVRLDYGLAPGDWRAAFRNPGA
jgi:ATP-dependent protease ClpP protease subunit